jgi:putative DNA primase/helicase
MSVLVAQHYAKLGYPVFPCRSEPETITIAGRLQQRAEKSPLTTQGFRDATTRDDVIAVWGQEFPSAAWGIATGRRSGLLVVDVDPKKESQWLSSLNQLELPQTLTVRTCNGGFHLYFAYSYPATGPRITIGANLLPGIDWRGEGGYVIAPGSVVLGRQYLIGKSLPIAAAPESLIERIVKHRKPRVIARDRDGRMLIPAGTRNEQLFHIACALRRYGVDFDPLVESLSAVNAAHCDPPVTDSELRAICASASTYAPAVRHE